MLTKVHINLERPATELELWPLSVRVPPPTPVTYLLLLSCLRGKSIGFRGKSIGAGKSIAGWWGEVEVYLVSINIVLEYIEI